jgi:hypothetical protein
MFESDNSFDDKEGLKVLDYQPLIKRKAMCFYVCCFFQNQAVIQALQTSMGSRLGCKS